MSKEKVTWDLKNNKTVKYTAFYDGSMIKKTGSLKLKNFKKVSSGKNYKVTCTVQWTLPSKFTSDEINGVIEGMYVNPSPTYEYYTVVDYQTGKCIESKNSYGVKTKQIGKWKYTGTKKYTDKYGDWFTQSQNVEVTFSVTYPKEYKDVCILAGSYVPGSSVDKFFKGKVNFADSGINQGVKKACHGMRVK
ncbi:MAG: hypothetical protein IJ733_07735 [Lachnospiraceae bacterium]|nr:hypothetical protein [Lachnospiraceae bacterium]